MGRYKYDAKDEQAARRLIRMIEDYWKARGFKPPVLYIDFDNARWASTLCIRSNMKNGMPPQNDEWSL